MVSYAYFGIFPALLRLSLLPFLDLRTTHVERLSCWMAMLVGAGAYVAALVAAFGRVDSKPIRRSMLVPLIFVALLSGPAIMPRCCIMGKTAAGGRTLPAYSS